MTTDVRLNPIFLLDNISPVLDDEAFLIFLELYYEWLQTTELTISSTSGTFQKEEIVIGEDSGARGIIKLLNNGSIVVKCTSFKPFEILETITGQTSAATSTISEIKDNVLKLSANLLRNKNPDFASGEYLEYLKTEFNNLYPTQTEHDRRELISKLRNLYESKSTEEAYRFLFRMVFNEPIEFRYPGEELLRISDGKFEKTIVIRVIANSDIFDFLNQTIRGASSGAVGNVVDIKLTFLGAIQYAEFTLSLVSGTFSAGETIFAVNDSTIANTTTYGMVTSFIINDGGSGYSIGDTITISGDGSEAFASISSISDGPINKLKINVPGQGYRIDTTAVINNAGTGGSGLYAKVTEISNTYTILQPVGGGGFNQYLVGDVSKLSILNRGSDYSAIPTITLIDTTIKNLGSLHENLITIVNSGNNYSVGDQLTFSGGSPTISANGQVASVGSSGEYGIDNILFEDSFVLVQETNINGKSSSIKDEGWTNSGPILRIELFDSANSQSSFGFGYNASNVASITISVTSGGGSNAQFTVNNIQGNNANVEVDIANNAVGIGSIRAIDISNFGIDYTSATVDATASGDGNANISAVISGTGISSGRFINDDGKIDYRIIQDSLFYQDFSYVIKSALTLNRYDTLVKELVHPAGLEFFGEISIVSLIEGLPVTARTILDFPSAIISDVNIGLPEPIQSIYKRYRIWGTSANPVGAEFRGNVIPIYETQIPLNTETVVNRIFDPVKISLTINTYSSHVEILELLVDVSIQNIESIVRSFSELMIYLDPIDVSPDFIPKTIEVNIELDTKNLSSSAEINAYEIELELEKNVAVNRVTELEIGIDLPISVSTPSSSREFQVKISPEIIPESLSSYVEYVNRLELYVDASTTWFSQVQIVETSTKIELEVILDQIDLHVLESKELQIKISPAIISESLSTDAEYVNRLELYVDVSTTWFSEVQVIETSTKITIEVVSEIIQLQTSESKEIIISLIPSKIGETVSHDAEYVNITQSETLLNTQEFREIEVDIDLIKTLTFDQSREIQLEISTDAIGETLATFTEYVNILDANTSIENNLFGKYTVTIIPEGPKSTQYHREIVLTLVPQIITSSVESIREHVNVLEIYVDATMGLYSDVIVMEAGILPLHVNITLEQYLASEINPGENKISLHLESIPIVGDTFREIITKTTSEIAVNTTEEINTIESEILSKLEINNFNQFRNNTITYGDTLIETLANRAISEDANKTFESVFGEKTVVKNIKISGTVSLTGNIVVGTGTSFTSDYGIDESFIVGNEKFIVTNVSNSTHMTLNLNAAGSYTGVSAYKEVSI